jgi:hypothetical protein
MGDSLNSDFLNKPDSYPHPDYSPHAAMLITSSFPSTGGFPSVLAMMTDFPLEDSPNSFDKSTVIVNTSPSSFI